MITYLDMITDALENVPSKKESFSSLRRSIKHRLYDCSFKRRKVYNNRAYIAAIKRGLLRGSLARDTGGNICLANSSFDRSASNIMCDAYRQTAETHREQRVEFKAVVGRRGFKYGSKGVPTRLLLHVQSQQSDKGIHMDHAWVTEGRSFSPFREGDVILFNARVRLYRKKSGLDYKLFYPTNVRRLRA